MTNGRVLVVGGSGFLGRHIVAELLGRGHRVGTLVRSARAEPPAGAERLTGDVERLGPGALDGLLDGYDAVVFAAGRDAGAPPPAPAERFFHEGNVAPVARLAAAARRTGCRSLVVCGSYLTALDRAHPQVGLVQRHPYVRSRAEQAAAARKAGRGAVAVAVLELPFVLGATPGRRSALDPLVPWLRSGLPLAAPRGGTAVLPVLGVARAAAYAVERAADGDFPLAAANLTWRQLFARLAEAAGRPAPVRVGTVPTVLLSGPMRGYDRLLRLRGRESGLSPRLAASVFTARLYLDPRFCREELGIGDAELEQALRETVHGPGAG